MTTRVIIMEALRIIMAIDSLRHNPANYADNMQACKLVRMNDSVFSATNFVESSDYGWNVQELARQALRSEGSLESRVHVFEKLVIDKLPSVLDEIKANQPSEYSIHFDNGVVLVAAFVGVVNQRPMLYHRRFLTSSTNSRIDVQKIDRSTDEKPANIIDGQTNANRHYDQEGITRRLDGIEEAKMRVELEIKADPTRVGGPIDIVTVDKDGIHWIDRKPECPDLEI